jgi:hypothetical protein
MDVVDRSRRTWAKLDNELVLLSSGRFWFLMSEVNDLLRWRK